MSDLREYHVWAQTAVHAKRVLGARQILERASLHAPFAVSVSWGKDSIAMLDLAIETLGRVTAIHMASPYALPGSEHVQEHFAARCGLHVLSSTRNLAEYIEWCREIGLPHERGRSRQIRVVTEIKRNRAISWCDGHGIVMQVLGLRIEEKGPRARVLRIRGPVYQLADGSWRANPLAYWSARDVWAYLVTRGLPWPRLYDCETHGMTRQTIRNTGWLSTDGAHEGRIAWLKFHFPDQYRDLLDAFPQVAMHQ